MGVGGEGMSGNLSRRGSQAAGRFQRRLEEASAEVAAESSAAPRIAVAAAGGSESDAASRLGGGATAGSFGGKSAETAKTTWGDDQPETAPGAGGSEIQWTPPEDRMLERLVRECVFDFDLVAARFSSTGDVGHRERGEGDDDVLVAEAVVV